MSKLSQEKINYIWEHLDTPNIELAKILGINRSTVRKYKKEKGVIYQPKNFHEYDEYIRTSYYEKSSKVLAEEIGCSQSYVEKIWRESNLKGKGSFRYYCNKNYFQKIDTSNKAYILGFIAADGCLYKRGGHQGLIQISLNKKDIQILEDIKKELNSTHPINICDNMASLSITSEEMFQDLNKIGIKPRKTWTINLNNIIENIPQSLVKDFIRGYFDGDGSITSSDNFTNISKTRIVIALPQKSGEYFVSLLKKFNIDSVFYQDNRKEHYKASFGSLDFVNTTQKYCFLKWIYLNSKSIKLERKFFLAKEFIQKVDSNETNRSENKKAILYWQSLGYDA